MTEVINSDIIDWDQWTEDMLKLTDELAKEKFKVGTPEYELQQGLIRSAEIYRKRKKCDKENNS